MRYFPCSHTRHALDVQAMQNGSKEVQANSSQRPLFWVYPLVQAVQVAEAVHMRQ